MQNTKFNYYKKVKWRDVFTLKEYNNIKIVSFYSKESRKCADTLHRLTDKVAMRRLVKEWRKDNKAAHEIKILSAKEYCIW